MDKKHRTDGRGQRTAKPGEIYAFYVDMLGRYGACQILEADGEGICYVLLDYLGAAPQIGRASCRERVCRYV